MTAAIVDITGTKKAFENDTPDLNINADLKIPESLEPDIAAKKKDARYFYTSGTFNFSFEKGFKPETLDNLELTKIPFLPSWYKGIVSIHGVIMPVIDILDFVKNNNVDAKETQSKVKKIYLLKLEHKNYNPIVFSLDSIPHLANSENYRKVDVTDDNTPEWIEGYLQDSSTKISLINHEKLFNQIIQTQ